MQPQTVAPAVTQTDSGGIGGAGLRGALFFDVWRGLSELSDKHKTHTIKVMGVAAGENVDCFAKVDINYVTGFQC